MQGDATASIGETSVSVFNGPDGETTAYSCDGNVLNVTGLPYGTLTFDRVDAPPEPAPVVIETGG
jgi:hypothetical protein